MIRNLLNVIILKLISHLLFYYTEFNECFKFFSKYGLRGIIGVIA